MKNKTSPVCIRMLNSWIDKLKEVAREKAYIEKKEINISDLIREATKEKWGLKDE